MPARYLPCVLPIPAVGWSPDRRALRFLDQRALPEREVVCEVAYLDGVIDAIRTLDSIISRMQEHQQKKRSLLRRLRAWDRIESVVSG